MNNYDDVQATMKFNMTFELSVCRMLNQQGNEVDFYRYECRVFGHVIYGSYKQGKTAALKDAKNALADAMNSF